MRSERLLAVERKRQAGWPGAMVWPRVANDNICWAGTTVGSWRQPFCRRVAVLITYIMSRLLLEAEPSVPRATRAPASRSSSIGKR